MQKMPKKIHVLKQTVAFAKAHWNILISTASSPATPLPAQPVADSAKHRGWQQRMLVDSRQKKTVDF